MKPRRIIKHERRVELEAVGQAELMPYPIVHLLRPEQLPHSRRQIDDALTESLRCALSISTCISPFSSDGEALIHINDALSMISPSAAFKGSYEQGEARTVSNDDHDSYCRIVRVYGDPTHVLLHAMLQTYRELLEDAVAGGTSLSTDDWAKLRAAFDSVFRYALRESHARWADAASRSPLWVTRFGRNRDPLRRWLIGHHVFLVLIQGLIVAVNCFAAALETRDLPEAESALNLATTLMLGSASSLRYTGDFDPDEYDSIVRPTMMPPSAPPGLSGLLAADHKHLVKLLTSMRAVFGSLHVRLQPAHKRFTEAFAETYEAHKYVCAQFRGGERPSLLNATTNEAAVDVLDQLKNSRLKLVKA